MDPLCLSYLATRCIKLTKMAARKVKLPGISCIPCWNYGPNMGVTVMKTKWEVA